MLQGPITANFPTREISGTKTHPHDDLTDSTDLTDQPDLPVRFLSKKHLIETDYLIVIIMNIHNDRDNRALSVYTIILLFYKGSHSRRDNSKFNIISNALNFMRY